MSCELLMSDLFCQMRKASERREWLTSERSLLVSSQSAELKTLRNLQLLVSILEKRSPLQYILRCLIGLFA